MEGLIECPKCNNFDTSCSRMKCLENDTYFENYCLVCKHIFISDNNGDFVCDGSLDNFWG